MKLTIDIDCDNDVFQAIDASLAEEVMEVIDDGLCRLQHELESDKNRDNVIFIGLYDSNENDVGTLRLIVRE